MLMLMLFAERLVETWFCVVFRKTFYVSVYVWGFPLIWKVQGINLLGKSGMSRGILMIVGEKWMCIVRIACLLFSFVWKKKKIHIQYMLWQNSDGKASKNYIKN